MDTDDDDDDDNKDGCKVITKPHKDFWSSRANKIALKLCRLNCIISSRNHFELQINNKIKNYYEVHRRNISAHFVYI